MLAGVTVEGSMMHKPYWVSADGQHKLFHGDCREVLARYKVCSISAIVSDPPYGVGFKYESHADVADTKTQYGDWIKALLPQLERLVVPGGALVFWQSGLYWRHIWEWFGEGSNVLIHAKNFVQLRGTAINKACDPIVVKYKDGARPRCPKKPPRNVDFFVSNTAALVSDSNRLERQHPCPRPLDAVVWVMQNFVEPQSVVLDPFAGSGTTGVACIRTGHRFVGVEIEEKYCKVAVERMERELAQPFLF